MNEQKFEINSKIDKLEKWNNRGNFILFFEKRQFFIISCFVLVQLDIDILERKNSILVETDVHSCSLTKETKQQTQKHTKWMNTSNKQLRRVTGVKKTANNKGLMS